MQGKTEQKTVQDQLTRIESQIRQIKWLLVVLILVSPVGLHCLPNLMGAIGTLGVVGFWIAAAIVGGCLLLVFISRLAGLHRTLALKQDELARIMREHRQREDGTPA